MLVVVALLVCATLFGQIKSSRIQLLEKQLDSLQQVAIPQLSEKVTISTVSMDFATIFSSISEQVNINFITDPNLKSKIVR